MHSDPHAHPAIRHHREWGAGLDPEGGTPPHGTPAAKAPDGSPRGGTIGPPPFPPNIWQMLLQEMANAAARLGQAAVDLPPIILRLKADPVNGPAFVGYIQDAMTGGSPAYAIVPWPYTPQSPSPTGQTTA